MVRPGTHPHPTRMWFLMLSFATVLIGVSVGWNVWHYAQVTGLVEVVGQEEVSSGFDTTAVEAVQKAFTLRAEEERRYRSEYHFVDPSR